MSKIQETSFDIWLKRITLVVAALVGIATLLEKLAGAEFAKHSVLWYLAVGFTVLGGVIVLAKRIPMPFGWASPLAITALYLAGLLVNLAYYIKHDTLGLIMIAASILVWVACTIRLFLEEQREEMPSAD